MNDIFRKFSFFFFSAFFCFSSITASALDSCEDVCCDDEPYLIDTCYSSTPLNECAWSISIRGGIAPTAWLNRGDAYIVIPASVPPVISIGRVKSYNDLFDLPWVAGLELAYNSTGNTQVFVEGVFRSSPNKNSIKRTVEGATPVVVTERMDDAKTWFGYLGARQYFNRDWICDSVAPYIGFKAGFVHHDKIRMKFFENSDKKGSFTLFEATTGVSAGVFLGLDCALMESLSLQLQGDLLVSQAIQGKRNIPLPVISNDNRVVTNIIAGRVNSEVSFPITVALRYSF